MECVRNAPVFLKFLWTGPQYLDLRILTFKALGILHTENE